MQLDFDDLPNEIIAMIFFKLGNIYQIAKCKRVCKRWWQVAQLYREESLSVRGDEICGGGITWRVRVRIPYDHLIDTRSFISLAQLKQLRLKPELKNLKKLSIVTSGRFDFNYNEINLFLKLEELNINLERGLFNYGEKVEGREVILELPKLRSLAIGSLYNTSFSIESQKLIKLSITTYYSERLRPRPVNVVYPERVKNLTTNRNLEEIEAFSNVEMLSVWRQQFIRKNQLTILNVFKKLTALNFEVRESVDSESLDRRGRSYTFRLLQKLLFDIQKIRPEFKITIRFNRFNCMEREIKIHPIDHETVNGQVHYESERWRRRVYDIHGNRVPWRIVRRDRLGLN